MSTSEVPPNLTDLAQKTEDLVLNSDKDNQHSDDDSDDEFHDAHDLVPETQADDVEGFTEDEILELILRAEVSKTEGNKLYINDQWEEAKQSYSHGLTSVPKRKPPLPSAPPKPAKDESDSAQEQNEKDESSPLVVPSTELEKRAASLRAQLNCNIGACCVKQVRPLHIISLLIFHIQIQGDHEGAVKACTEALIDDPKYIKALQRRASSNEIIGSWSALSSAESDYTALLDLLLPSSQPAIRLSLARLKPRVEEAKERETAEMMGKLKDLGNSILGRFGMSTDNFQFTPNGQGGYGLNFVR
ncbi:hypothetical protein FRC12_011238 [Ceratobasidium sp. 428]|nr:hypothetical protein FRC12_011238 [Ceratobasidium sp. 428]